MTAVDDRRMRLPDVSTMTEQELYAEALALLKADDRYRYDWTRLARPDQRQPADYLVWLILAGVGWGKTRTGAETCRERAEQSRTPLRIAVVAKSHREVQQVCFEAPRAGLVNVIPPEDQREYLRTSGSTQLTLKSGTTFRGFSAQDPDAIRGYAFDFVWCDEYASWPIMRAQETYDQLWFRLRESRDPGMVITTTPKPYDHIRKLVARALTDPKVELTRGHTLDNRRNLGAAALEEVLGAYGDSRLGRQELGGELLDDVDNAFARQADLNRCRVLLGDVPHFAVVVTSIDPATTAKSSSDETGIISMGMSADAHVYVLDDVSGKYSPDGWAQAAWEQALEHGSHAVVVEDNAGGDMCEAVLNTAWLELVRQRAARGQRTPPKPPIVRVHPSGEGQGKWARAQPIGVLYEQREQRMHHVHDPAKMVTVRVAGRDEEQHRLARLEQQQTTWTGAKGEPSPDRNDALVHGATWMLFPNRRAGKQARAASATPAQRWAQQPGDRR